MKRKHKHRHASGEVTELARETAKVEQYWETGSLSPIGGRGVEARVSCYMSMSST